MSSLASTRMHLRVGPDTFIVMLLRVGEDDSWFGQQQLDELLSLLRDELPYVLPDVLGQRTVTRFESSHCGKTLQARLQFLPCSRTWLLEGGDAAQALSALPYTMLVDAEPTAVRGLGNARQ